MKKWIVSLIFVGSIVAGVIQGQITCPNSGLSDGCATPIADCDPCVTGSMCGSCAKCNLDLSKAYDCLEYTCQCSQQTDVNFCESVADLLIYPWNDMHWYRVACKFDCQD
jgi:hypothetical protein